MNRIYSVFSRILLFVTTLVLKASDTAAWMVSCMAAIESSKPRSPLFSFNRLSRNSSSWQQFRFSFYAIRQLVKLPVPWCQPSSRHTPPHPNHLCCFPNPEAGLLIWTIGILTWISVENCYPLLSTLFQQLYGNSHIIEIFSCEAQLNTCFCALSVCPWSNLNFILYGQLMTAYDYLWQLMTTYDSLWQLMTTYDIFWQLLTTYTCTLCELSSSQDLVVGLVVKLRIISQIKCQTLEMTLE